jgi:uncharacterized protein DUF6526
MAEREAQSYANHARFVPLYHFFIFGVLLLAMGFHVYMLIWFLRSSMEQSVVPLIGTVIAILGDVALMLVAFYARVFALAAQDRVIRLEERMRMAQLLPDDLRARSGELSTGQLVALRFASDEELPELVRQVLDGGIRNRKAIKMMIRSWRPDHQRV